ncbi:MAG: hypothetical protein KIT31_08305 [Deltaproteobacteria bacterium]|nr:hypothetical protein [Deltaproteobacteria bacterium]
MQSSAPNARCASAIATASCTPSSSPPIPASASSAPGPSSSSPAFATAIASCLRIASDFASPVFGPRSRIATRSCVFFGAACATLADAAVATTTTTTTATVRAA